MITATETRILLDRGHNFYDTLIRWQTWGSVAHAKIWFPQYWMDRASATGLVSPSWAYDRLRLPGVIIEAVAKGVIVRPWADSEDAQSEQYQVDEEHLNEWGYSLHWDKAFAFATQQIGKPYDFFGLAKFLLRDGRENPHRWFCSDLVFEIVRQAGRDLLARCPRYKVSPERLRTSPLLVLPSTAHSGSVQAVT